MTDLAAKAHCFRIRSSSALSEGCSSPCLHRYQLDTSIEGSHFASPITIGEAALEGTMVLGASPSRKTAKDGNLEGFLHNQRLHRRQDHLVLVIAAIRYGDSRSHPCPGVDMFEAKRFVLRVDHSTLSTVFWADSQAARSPRKLSRMGYLSENFVRAGSTRHSSFVRPPIPVFV
jgi:hypothetical protein